MLAFATEQAFDPQTVEAATQALLATPAGRRALSLQSPVFFDSYYCGMRYATHREEWLSTLHGMKREARRSRRKRKLLLLAPRDHGKTEAFISFAAQTIAEDRNIRILWVSESLGVGKKRLARVKSLLESQRFADDWCTAPDEGFGPLRTGTEKWTETMFYASRTLASVDPTFEAVGAGGAITGGHFDIILFDDVESDKTVYTAAQRAKTRSWFVHTVLPMLAPGGLMAVIGTRKHHDDLYAHRKADATFEVIEDRAITVWPQVLDDVTGEVHEGWEFSYERDKYGRKVCTGVTVSAPATVLWPEERGIEYLLLERHGSSPTAFGREFQHEVVDENTALFKMRDIERAREKGASLSLYEIPEGVVLIDVVQSWDLALVTDEKRAELSDTDYTVGETWAKDLDGNRYLLGIARFRGLLPSQLRDKVKAEFQRFVRLGLRPRVVAVERNAFGEIHFLGLQRSTDLPLRPHLTTGAGKADLWDGVASMAALFENGKVVLPCKTEDDQAAIKPFCDELHGLGKEAHDDTVLAWWIGDLHLRMDPFEYRMAFGDGEINTANSAGTVETHYVGEQPRRLGDPAPPSTEPTQEVLDAAFWEGLRL